MLDDIAEHNRKLSVKELESATTALALLGTSLSVLYQASTCHRKCFGGPHVLEGLCGRAYNLACGSYLLICRGFYDEALNLVRSIGEIANLISLSVVDKEALRKWLQSDVKTRIREFGPAKVRKLLARHEPFLTCADQNWYTRFCENYTHVHPGTKPNVHNPDGKAYVGGIVQHDGIKLAIDELTNVITHLAMFVSKYTQMDDLFSEIRALIRSQNDKPASEATGSGATT